EPVGHRGTGGRECGAVRVQGRGQPGGVRHRAGRDVSRRCTGRSCAFARTIACLTLAATTTALATPYVPDADTVVLEHVPARSALERLSPLRAAVAARPQDAGAALALAQGFIEIGRRE